MIEKEFTWRGLRFVWNGRLRKWICERPEQQSGHWWVTWHTYEHSFMVKEGQAISWDDPPEDFMPGTFASVGWMAHLGHGDAALRDTRNEALEAALQYALRFHHHSLAQLRTVLYAHEELCRAIAGAGPTLTPLYCEHPKNHEGGHSWEIRQ